MSIACKYSSSKEAKDAKWFSRRHQNSEAHSASHARILAKKQAQLDNMKREAAHQLSVKKAGTSPAKERKLAQKQKKQ